MSDNEMLYCLIAFILGWLASRMMGNGFSVGGQMPDRERYRLNREYKKCIHNNFVIGAPDSANIKRQTQNCNCPYICQGLAGLGESKDLCKDYIRNNCPLHCKKKWVREGECVSDRDILGPSPEIQRA